MAHKSKSSQPDSAKTAQSIHIKDRISQRAYELYDQRGRVDGFAFDDWLQAEAEMLGAQKPKVKSAKASK